ncbi:ankyrin repeat-containing domain protein [Sphaerosporella brunnea]|uniref:Ankyrin repeat-containing domain protein n=1 Tax=Sphaerosporella brunnea TaxID=1250544 RepID=A0A5J5EZ31_9PEZI|nr:ankyrin repeat-containing domain protein [Sphaerosporella brunnea]
MQHLVSSPADYIELLLGSGSNLKRKQSIRKRENTQTGRNVSVPRLALGQFQASLSPDQRNQFTAVSSSPPTAIDVVRLADGIDKKNSTRRSREWAQQTRGILEGVQQYCAIVDTFVQANPAIAALVWGSIKFTILAALNFSDYFESLSRRFEQLGKSCPRLREYEKIFKDSVRVRDALSDYYAIVIEFCTKALLGIQEKGFKRLLKSLVKPYSVDFGPLQESLDATREEVDAEILLASELKAHSSRELQRIEFRENERHRSHYRVEVQENRVARSLQGNEAKANRWFRSEQLVRTAEINKLQIQKIAKEEERYRIRLLQKICTHDYTKNLREARRKRCVDTGRWLFERPEYKKWWEGTLPNCLWCCGTAGCGKTVITGNVIDRLLTTPSTGEGRVVAYYFFDYRWKESLSIITFLRSILHQVLRMDTISPEIVRRLQAIFDGPIVTREPDFNELQKIIDEVCTTLKEVFFVIDGLDEVDKDSRKTILQFLKAMQSRVKIFAAGQPEVDMTAIFVGCATIYITAHDLEDDIRKFVQVQLEEDNELNAVLSTYPALIDAIKELLASKAQGMFLWVDLQIKAIHDACEDDGTADRVPQLLDDLPRDIGEIYSRALQKLLCSGDQKVEQTRKIFQWVICARRPMNISELEEAATIVVGQKFWKEPSIKLNWPKLSKLCGNLLTWDDSDGTIFLAHHSVLQFLQTCASTTSIARFHFKLCEADRHLGEICITYLNFADFEKSLTTTPDSSTLRPLAKPLDLGLNVLPRLNRVYRSERSSRAQKPLDNCTFSVEEHLRTIMATSRASRINPHFALLDYCRSNWYHHCTSFTSDDGGIADDLKNLVLRKKNLPFYWRPWEPSDGSKHDGTNPFPHWAMFYWAVRHAHTHILEIWKNMVSERVATDSWKRLWETDGRDIFFSACATANTNHVDIMLKNRNSDVWARSNEMSRALAHAASSGHLAVINRLLQEKPNLNAIAANGDQNRTALQAAAEGGHVAVIERLLQENADVNAAAVGRHGRTALQAAAGGGHLAVVEWLLQENADINAAAVVLGGRTALQAAAGGGHLAVVERLLQENVDINAAAAKFYGRTALQAAVGGGHLAVVEWLLQENADVNAAAAENDGRTALQASAGGGHLAVVEQLLQENADVNAAAAKYNGRTALQAAAGGGHMAVVERLLQENADVNAAAVALGGRTALQAAAGGGHLAVVERLLQENADVNAAAATFYGRTTLQAAAGGGHLAVVERLLQENANVNAAAAEHDGRTALQAAAGGGHLAVVERLLQENAGVNAAAVKYNGRTALQAAADGGHLAVVERLLQENANVNAAAVVLGSRTALQAAAGGGHLAVVERLLQENADVNAAAASEAGRTALQAAAGGGHLAVVQRLLQENADVNAVAAKYNGRTALQAAAGGGHLAVVERLLQENAGVNAAAAEHKGRTALQAAAGGGHLAVVERLLQENADFNAAAVALGGRMALQAAAGGGHLTVVERLLQENADVNAAAAKFYGRTALQAAADGGHLAVVERLSSAGGL